VLAKFGQFAAGRLARPCLDFRLIGHVFGKATGCSSVGAPGGLFPPFDSEDSLCRVCVTVGPTKFSRINQELKSQQHTTINFCTSIALRLNGTTNPRESSVKREATCNSYLITYIPRGSFCLCVVQTESCEHHNNHRALKPRTTGYCCAGPIL